jgi:hypothetical protein
VDKVRSASTLRIDSFISAFPACSAANLFTPNPEHNFKKWKPLLKGEYDKLKHTYKFLVTGSSRLDIYCRGGDSLQGRYHYFRLHPFTLAEILEKKNRLQPFLEIVIGHDDQAAELEGLMRFGGFPEPLFKQNTRFLRRWHNEKNERLFREDIQDMALIRDLSNMKLLSDLLPNKVGSLLSINAIREDLEVSHRAAASWLDVLESFHYHFRIYPFARRTIRSIKKEPKLYLWDWSEVDDESARFENLIASHLLKLVHFLHDYEGWKAGLYFLRNVDKKEVDFLVTVNEKPWFAVEVKRADHTIAAPLYYFKEKLKIPYVYQVISVPGIDILKKSVRLVSAGRFLFALL